MVVGLRTCCRNGGLAMRRIRRARRPECGKQIGKAECGVPDEADVDALAFRDFGRIRAQVDHRRAGRHDRRS